MFPQLVRSVVSHLLAARAHEAFSPADRLGERIAEGVHRPLATSLT